MMRSWSLSEEKSKAAAEGARKGVREKLKHAFAVAKDTEPLAEEDIALLDKAATFIVRRRLSLPAEMLLEALTPLNFIGSQAMVVLEPLLGPFFPRDDYARIIKILSRRDGLNIFIQRIEGLAAKSHDAKRQDSH
jgi:hypothetical protein